MSEIRDSGPAIGRRNLLKASLAAGATLAAANAGLFASTGSAAADEEILRSRASALRSAPQGQIITSI